MSYPSGNKGGKSMKRKWLAIGVILLLIVIAFVPVCSSQTTTTSSESEEAIPKIPKIKLTTNANDVLINSPINYGTNIHRFNELIMETSDIPSTFQKTPKSSSLVKENNWWYVGGSGPGNYTDIQDAIDNASDGDTVFVYNGTYQAEWITIDKALNLLGEDKNTTVLDGRYSNNMIILVESSDVTIRGFTLENCMDNGLNQAIYLWGHPHFHTICISDCIMIHNDKGIFFINVSEISISSCDIHYNDAQGIWGFYSSFIDIENCSLHNNGKNIENRFVPGGITINDMKSSESLYSGVSITHCAIYANKGWGIDVERTRDVQIHHNNMYSNLIGIHFDGITDLDIYENMLSMNNGGVECFGFPPSFDVVIQKNNFSRSGGERGGLYLQCCPDIRVVNNSFYHNNIGIYPNAAQHTYLSNNKFTNNNIGVNMSSSSQCTVRDNIFLNNHDAGIYIQTGSPGVIIENNTIQGGTKGIYVGQASDGLRIFHNTITNGSIGIGIFFSGGHNISSNTLANMSERAFYLNSSWNNMMYHNNIVNCRLNPYIYNFAGPKNRWVGNYWNRPRVLPKLLVGMQERILPINNVHLKLPLFEVDWHPAQIPYCVGE
jgi:parallel beta-helix repeat protein